jgi:hypothetical protein
MDTDGDGNVSLAEFISARPSDTARRSTWNSSVNQDGTVRVVGVTE